MAAYFIRRLLLIIPTFIGITIMVFVITRFVPGGPVERIISQVRQMATMDSGSSAGRPAEGQTQPLSDEQIEELKQYYGFDKPVLISYLLWLGKVLQGDLGVSTRYYDPVWEMIRERIPISLYFGGISLVLVYGICIPLGIAKAIRHKSVFDNTSSVVVFVGYAIPGWVVGVLLLVAFASHWEFFPLGGLVSDDFDAFTMMEKALDIAWHTVLPLIAYMLGSFTVLTFLMKNTLMDNLAADYVRTAIAKGPSFPAGGVPARAAKQPHSRCHQFRQQHLHRAVRIVSHRESVQYKRDGTARLRVCGGKGLSRGVGDPGHFIGLLGHGMSSQQSFTDSDQSFVMKEC